MYFLETHCAHRSPFHAHTVTVTLYSNTLFPFLSLAVSLSLSLTFSLFKNLSLSLFLPFPLSVRWRLSLSVQFWNHHRGRMNYLHFNTINGWWLMKVEFDYRFNMIRHVEYRICWETIYHSMYISGISKWIKESWQKSWKSWKMKADSLNFSLSFSHFVNLLEVNKKLEIMRWKEAATVTRYIRIVHCIHISATDLIENGSNIQMKAK